MIGISIRVGAYVYIYIYNDIMGIIYIFICLYSMPQGAISSTQYDILWQGLAEAERKHLPLLDSPDKVQRLKGIITDDFFLFLPPN